MIRMKLIAIAFAALGSSGFAIAGDDHGGPVTPRPYTTGATLTKAVQASITPDNPPSRNVTMKPTQNSIGVSNVNCPFHMVPIQLKNFMPVGTAIRYDMNEKNGRRTAPVANMWCAHTAVDSAAMLIVA